MKNEEFKPVYKTEFAILDTLYGKLDFSIFENPVLAESNLFCVMAWYIERLKNVSKNWEEEINTFIENALKIDDVFDRFKYMEKHYIPIEIEYYKQIPNGGFNAELCQDILDGLDEDYEEKKEKKSYTLCGIRPSLVPSWFWTWFDGHELEKKVMAENRRNFVKAMQHGMNKYDSADKDDD